MSSTTNGVPPGVDFAYLEANQVEDGRVYRAACCGVCRAMLWIRATPEKRRIATAGVQAGDVTPAPPGVLDEWPADQKSSEELLAHMKKRR